MIFLIAVLVAVAAFPTFVVLAAGLVPAAVASMIDETPERDFAACVLAANFCGVLPSLADLWWQGNTLVRALAILSDPFSWLAMVGSAALGWGLALAIPPLIAGLLAVVAEQKVRRLKAYQRRLVEEWGEAVAGGAGDEVMAARAAGRIADAGAG